MLYIENKWITSQGKVMSIKSMTTSHIQNTIAYLQRNPLFYAEGIYDFDYIDCEPNYNLVQDKIEELTKELNTRL